MLIKSKDDESAFLKELEPRAAGTGPTAKQAATELRIRKAGLKGESESAYLINFHFERSPNWAVIHDLRLEYRGRTAQIDHLLINRWLDIYVLESKHFNAGLKITADGEFLRWDDYRKTYTGMASPLEQNERHIAVLQDVTETLEWPQRLGLRIAPTFHSLILIAPAARIDRAKQSADGAASPACARPAKRSRCARDHAIGQDAHRTNDRATAIADSSATTDTSTLANISVRTGSSHCGIRGVCRAGYHADL
jgi:hypothetical protein